MSDIIVDLINYWNYYLTPLTFERAAGSISEKIGYYVDTNLYAWQ